MKYGGSQFLSCARKVRRPLLFLLLVLSVKMVNAQPGNRSPEFLQSQIAELTKQIETEPQNTALYLRRADLYMKLYQTFGGRENQSHLKEALTDISAAIELNPTAEAYLARALGYQSLWHDAFPASGEPGAIVDHHLKNEYAEAAKSDFLDSIRLDHSDKNLGAYFWLNSFYLARAKDLARPAVMRELVARGEGSAAWSAFDSAIEYAVKIHELGRDDYLTRIGAATAYSAKGQAATELGEYDLALESFAQGEKYLYKDGGESCRFYSAWADLYFRQKNFAQARDALSKAITAEALNCRWLLERRGDAYFGEGEWEKARDDYDALWVQGREFQRPDLAFKRARLYLKLNQPEQGLDAINQVIRGFYSCPQIYRLRAEIYRRLGKPESAAADEENATKLNDSACERFK